MAYWAVVVILSLWIVGSFLFFLYFEGNSNPQGAGWAWVMYLVVVVGFGWVPGAIALVVCIVDLVLARKLPDNKRRLVTYLCGSVLVAVLLGAIVIFCMNAIPFWGLLFLIYFALISVPWIAAKREKLL